MIAVCRWLFIGLLAAHGIAHLPGFAVSWRLMTSADVPYHTSMLNGRFDIGDLGVRVLGAVWLCLSAGFVATAWFTAARGRWAFAAIAVLSLLSLALCVLEWPYARVGVWINLLLVLSLPFVAHLSWREQTNALADTLHRGDAPRVQRLSRETMLTLPPIVARYFERALGADPRIAAAAVFEQQAEFMLGGRWRPLSATQFVRADPPGFVWDARVAMAPGVPALVRDSYVGGHGAMQATLAGVLPMVAQQGRAELDAGALHRYVAELVWMPSRLLPGLAVHWTPIDALRAQVTFVDGPTTVSLEFRFDASGDVIEIFTPQRYAEHDGTYQQEPWLVRCRDYQTFDGIRIPGYCEVSWLTAEGAAPYWRGRITSAHYEFNADTKAESTEVRREAVKR